MFIASENNGIRNISQRRSKAAQPGPEPRAAARRRPERTFGMGPFVCRRSGASNRVNSLYVLTLALDWGRKSMQLVANESTAWKMSAGTQHRLELQ
jgi:hypothetical protein